MLTADRSLFPVKYRRPTLPIELLPGNPLPQVGDVVAWFRGTVYGAPHRVISVDTEKYSITAELLPVTSPKLLDLGVRNAYQPPGIDSTGMTVVCTYQPASSEPMDFYGVPTAPLVQAQWQHLEALREDERYGVETFGVSWHDPEPRPEQPKPRKRTRKEKATI